MESQHEKDKGNLSLLKWIMAISVLVALIMPINSYVEKINTQISETQEAVERVARSAQTANDRKTLDTKLSDVIEAAKDSVVLIEIVVKDEYVHLLQGAKSNLAVGTGWFVQITDEYAYVVTNHHVIEDHLEYTERTYLRVGDRESPWYFDAEVVGHDIIADIAVLRVKNPDMGWKSLPWADHELTRPGDSVVAIGHGMSLPWSMSAGIITGMDRHQIRKYQLMIQTDAVVNKGNSGGPLLNLAGEVVGVVDALLDPNGINYRNSAAYAGVSLVISGWQAQKSIDEIIKYGKVDYPKLDFTVKNTTREEYQKIKDAGYHSYVIIDEVPSDSNGLSAGLKSDDVIIAVNDTQVDGIIPLIKQILSRRVDDTVNVTVLRGTETIDVEYSLPALEYNEPK